MIGEILDMQSLRKINNILIRRRNFVTMSHHLLVLLSWSLAGMLVKAEQDIGNTMGELGLALIKLTKFENEKAMLDTQRTHASNMKNVATASLRMSRIYRALNAKTDILHEYLEVMLAAGNAFLDRSNALLTVQTLVSGYLTLQSKVEKLEASSSKGSDKDNARVHKVEELKETIRVTGDAKNCAVREYERIKENTRSEFDLVNRERRVDLLDMLKGFVNVQIDCAEKMADVWSTVAADTSDYAQESS